jgi:dissimilatory sulfite reductase (desulfoviridin) alpha/beta subunit
LGKDIDPRIAVEARIELAEKYFAEAKEYLAKGDAVQASEKLYKVVEECIKALAQHYNMPEHQEAVKEGRWWIQLLGKASRGLSRELKEPKITDVWSRAYDIHVWGFHETKYTIEDIKEDAEYVDWLLNYVKQKLVR